MNYSVEDILARIQDGDSVDDIAKEMTDALNEAKAQYDAAEAKRQAELEAARKQAEEDARAYQEKEEKKILVDNIIQSVITYLEYTGHQDMANQLIDSTDADVDTIAEAFDAMIELFEMTEKLKVLEYGNPFNPVGMKKLRKPVQKAVDPTPDDIISEFLKTL
jgi:hypothetical protein